MAASSSEAIKQSGPQTQTQKLVLRVHVDCEGCRKKVTKILHSITGVESCDVDIKQQRVVVVVTGNVDADTLISKLVKKTGKHAELWPAPKIHKKKKPKEKPTQESDELESGQENIAEEQQRALRHEEPESNENSEAAEAEQGKEAVREDGLLPEDNKKKKKKKAVEGSAAIGDPSQSTGGKDEVREKKVSEGNKKKSKGQNGDDKSQNRSESQLVEDSSPPPPNPITPRRRHHATSAEVKGHSISVPPTNHISARHPNPNHISAQVNDTTTPGRYAQPAPPNAVPPGYYNPPPQRQPIYTVSYSSAPQPQMSYGRTYYATGAAAQPANSWSYMYQGNGPYPRPSNHSVYHSHDDQVDYDMYRQQPESFGLFSDENPNACLIM